MPEPILAPPALAAERERFPSAADYAYAEIREAIVDGRFAPARRMREIELSEWLGISRTPLRQALARLELDGLLENLPRAGLVVSSLDEQAVFELYETREALEGTAAAMAARHATERDLDRLEALLGAFEPAGLSSIELFRANRAFHEAIYGSAHNRFLLKSLKSLHDALALLGPTTLTVAGRPEQAREEHGRMVRAIRGRDPVAAETEARTHIRNGFPLRKRLRAQSG